MYMLKNKKGFTLIELLAVVAIIAVVSLIAVTAVIPRMNKAKKRSFLDEAEVYLKVSDEIDIVNPFTTKCFNISEINGEYITKDNSDYSGTLYVFPDGSPLLSLTNGKFYIVTTGDPTIDDISDTMPSVFASSCTSSNVNPYYIVYDANGGTGSVSSQTVYKDLDFTLNDNSFTKGDLFFVKWNTKADGTGKDYYAGQTVNNLSNGETITLYAQWATDKYEYLDSFTFTGSNYLNSNIQLFSSTTFYRDFEVSFDIVSRNTTTNLATMVASMDESSSPYPGFVYRVSTSSNVTNDSLTANSYLSTEATKTYTRSTTNSVAIKRKDKILYVSINNGDDVQLLDTHTLARTFTSPVAFGCSLKANGTCQRYFKGTLKNMRVYIMEEH